MENQTLATELMKELTLSAKRWFFAFIVMVILEICTIGGFMWYLSLPIDEVTVESEDGNANYVGDDVMGAIYNDKSDSEETSTKK